MAQYELKFQKNALKCLLASLKMRNRIKINLPTLRNMKRENSFRKAEKMYFITMYQMLGCFCRCKTLYNCILLLQTTDLSKKEMGLVQQRFMHSEEITLQFKQIRKQIIQIISDSALSIKNLFLYIWRNIVSDFTSFSGIEKLRKDIEMAVK
jgi:hypothetical protein